MAIVNLVNSNSYEIKKVYSTFQLQNCSIVFQRMFFFANCMCHVVVQDHERQHGAILPRSIVFQCAGWDQYWNDSLRYWGNVSNELSADWHFPGFSGEAARWLVKHRNIRAIGKVIIQIIYCR